MRLKHCNLGTIPKKSTRKQAHEKGLFKQAEKWYNLRDAGCHEIALRLYNEDGLLHGNYPMDWQSVDTSIKLGIVRPIFWGML